MLIRSDLEGSWEPLRSLLGRSSSILFVFLPLVSIVVPAAVEAESDRTNFSAPTPLVLVLPEEAAQGPYRMRSTEYSSRGPKIVVSSPEMNATYDGDFPLHVSFMRGKKGYDVNMASLRLTYQKGWGLDITDRVIEYVRGMDIDVPAVSLPPGKHAVEIYIEDVEAGYSAKQTGGKGDRKVLNPGEKPQVTRL